MPIWPDSLERFLEKVPVFELSELFGISNETLFEVFGKIQQFANLTEAIPLDEVPNALRHFAGMVRNTVTAEVVLNFVHELGRSLFALGGLKGLSPKHWFDSGMLANVAENTTWTQLVQNSAFQPLAQLLGDAGDEFGETVVALKNLTGVRTLEDLRALFPGSDRFWGRLPQLTDRRIGKLLLALKEVDFGPIDEWIEDGPAILLSLKLEEVEPFVKKLGGVLDAAVALAIKWRIRDETFKNWMRALARIDPKRTFSDRPVIDYLKQDGLVPAKIKPVLRAARNVLNLLNLDEAPGRAL